MSTLTGAAKPSGTLPEGQMDGDRHLFAHADHAQERVLARSFELRRVDAIEGLLKLLLDTGEGILQSRVGMDFLGEQIQRILSASSVRQRIPVGDRLYA